MQAAEQLPQREGRAERTPREGREAQQSRMQALRTETDRVRSADLEDRRATLSQIYMHLNATRTLDEAMTMARRDIMGEEALLKSRQVIAIPEEELQQVQSHIRVVESIQKGTLGSGDVSHASAEWQGKTMGAKEASATTFQNIDTSAGASRAEPMTMGMRVPPPELKRESIPSATQPAPDKAALATRRRDAIARLKKLGEEASQAKAAAETQAKQQLAGTTDEDIDQALDRLTPSTPPPPPQSSQLH